MQRYLSACTKDFQKRSPKIWNQDLNKYFSLLHLLSLSHVYYLVFSFSFPLLVLSPHAMKFPKNAKTSINKPVNKTVFLQHDLVYLHRLSSISVHAHISWYPSCQATPTHQSDLNHTLTNTGWIQWICTRFRCTLNFMFDLSRGGLWGWKYWCWAITLHSNLTWLSDVWEKSGGHLVRFTASHKEQRIVGRALFHK